MSSLKIPVFPGLNHFIWSGPQNLGPDRKFLVRTPFFWCKPLAWNVPEKSGINHGFWFKPGCVVWTRNSGLNQLPFGLLKPGFDGAVRDCVRSYRRPHSKPYTVHRTEATRALSPLRRAPHGEAARKPTRLACARSRSPARPLHKARQRGSRQGSHARAPAQQSDHSTWRGSEEACERELHASLPKAPLGLGPPQSES